jgi:hypothetical protein
LRLTCLRSVVLDSSGFTFNNARLISISDETANLIQSALGNSFTAGLVQLPGSRILFGDLMSFSINFDRLQLYYYHNRNYSLYSNILLEYINEMDNLKGTLISSLYELIRQNASENINNLFLTMDYKLPYSSSTMTKNANGSGFLINNYNIIIYNIPGTIILFIILQFFFKLLKEKKVLKFVRKFCFIGIFFQMIYEGNIEQLIFYIMG